MHASEFARKRARIERRAGGRAAFFRKAMDHLVREAGAVEVIVRGQTMAWQLPDGGVVCAKIRYREAEAAQMELGRIARFARHQAVVPVRAYACQHCGGFHLTHQQRRAANDNTVTGLSDERQYSRK